MANESSDKDWKLNLRYGKLVTPYTHFTLIAEGIAGELKNGFSCQPGTAFMGMKVWATTTEEAADMICSIGEQIGFRVTRDIQIYETDPVEPPGDEPFGYDINFTPLSEKA